MAAAKKVHIIGIGDDGVDGATAAARQLIAEADLVMGAEPTISKVAGGRISGEKAAAGAKRPERLVLGNNLDEAVARITASPDKRIVVLASGDPLFYGVARYLCDKLGKDRFEVVPHVSSMQLAFARVKESWEEAFLTNLANRSLDEVVEKIRVATKVGLFTSDASPPAAVAQALLARKIDYFWAYVCENLGSPDERVTQGELAEIAAGEFAPLNVMVLVRKPNVPDRPSEAIGRRLFGNHEENFLQTKPKHGLLTPAEVRAVALAEMDLGPTSIVWDVGAGSGSVSIEAAQIAAGGTTYAIEMDPDDNQLIKANAERFNVRNLVAVLGCAPQAWEGLPAPDAIFVGGSGREVASLVEQSYERLRPGGRLVASVASIENLAAVHELLKKQCPDVKVWMMNIARGTDQLERLRFEALNPTFLFAVVKPAS